MIEWLASNEKNKLKNIFPRFAELIDPLKLAEEEKKELFSILDELLVSAVNEALADREEESDKPDLRARVDELKQNMALLTQVGNGDQLAVGNDAKELEVLTDIGQILSGIKKNL